MEKRLIPNLLIACEENKTSKNISKCMKCKAIIRREIDYDGVINWDEIEQPSYCHECGTPYPWSSSKFKALIQMVEYFKLNAEKDEN